MAKIAILGNSHVRDFFGEGTSPDQHYDFLVGNHRVILRQLGSTGATAYSLSKESSRTGAGVKIVETLSGSGPFDWAFLVFGDVDIREHTWKHVTDDHVAAVEETVSRYVDFVKTTVSPLVRNISLVAPNPYSGPFLRSVAHDKARAATQFHLATFVDGIRRECERNGWSLCCFQKNLVDAYGRMRQVYMHSQDNPEDVHLDHSLVCGEARRVLLEIVDGSYFEEADWR